MKARVEVAPAELGVDRTLHPHMTPTYDALPPRKLRSSRRNQGEGHVWTYFDSCRRTNFFQRFSRGNDTVLQAGRAAHDSVPSLFRDSSRSFSLIAEYGGVVDRISLAVRPRGPASQADRAAI